MSIAAELQNLKPSARLEFFVVDVTALGGPLLRFHNGTNELRSAVVWQGQEYSYLPIRATGFETRSDGPAPRPVIEVGDIGGAIGAMARTRRNLAGAILTRKQMHARYLDAVNFAAGNPYADPTSQYPDQIWVFDRIRGRNGLQIAWELVSPLDLDDTMLPGRQVKNTGCGSQYRSAECGYAGGPVAKVDDTPTSDPALDECSRKVSGCKKRFGETAVLPIDFFPGAGTIRQL